MRPLPRVALCIAVLLLLAGAAGAADGDPYLKSVQPAAAAADAEVSPDARHLYVAVGNGVQLFDVAASGTIAARPVAAATTPQAPQDVDLSPDGRNVYLSAGDRLVVLSRDASTGALTELQCFGPAPCSAVLPGTFASAAVSPDGRSVYARSTNRLLVFDRETATGRLIEKPATAGCLEEQSGSALCASVVGIAGAGGETAVSPDGRHVYASNDSPGGVAVFSRDIAGALTQRAGTQGGCVTAGGLSGTLAGTCMPGSSTLAQALAVNVDPKGAFVVVSGETGNTLFRRDSATGALSQSDCLDELGGGPPPVGCHEVKGAAGGDAAISSDGLNVALNARDLGLSAFRLDRTQGKLAQRPSRGCFSVTAIAPCQHVAGLTSGLGAVTFSANGRFLFAASRGGSVASFENDLAPTCRAKTVSVPRNRTVFVPLACTDVNGDALKLEIAAPPTNGSLGIVDQKRQRVAYKPETNFAGRDLFQYRASSRGTRGTPAIVRVNVLKRGRLVDRKPPNTRIKSGPTGRTSSTSARFLFASTERGSRFECKLDKQRWTRCRTPKSYSQLKRGRHAFSVRAVDRAGNVDLSPAKRSWMRR